MGVMFVLPVVLWALSGCDPRPVTPAAREEHALRILAGSELRDIAPALQQAAEAAGVSVRFEFAGSVDLVDRANAEAGARGFDAILPASGAYPALALASSPLARERLFYSRVAVGVKASRWRDLGWDRHPPGWTEVVAAIGQGRLRYAMTNPTSSNSGMSALFAVAAAAAGKAEDLSRQDARAPAVEATLRRFLSGQKLIAGSSGWLAEAYVRDQDALDGMINYESVILRLNARTGEAALREPLVPVYPVDGVISADYPLMLLAPADDAMRRRFDQVVRAWRAPAVQGEVLAGAFLRPSSPQVHANPALSGTSAVELAFPGRLDVIDAVLSAYLAEWRRPASAIFVLDVSGSMQGERIAALRRALGLLTGIDAAGPMGRYTRFQPRERVLMLPFSEQSGRPELFTFTSGEPEAAVRARIRDYVDALQVGGGTAIFSALNTALDLGREELHRHPQHLVSIILLTDGVRTSGVSMDAFERHFMAGAPVRVFPILFGAASVAEMSRIAEVSGGRVFDGKSASLDAVFRDIRGYQ